MLSLFGIKDYIFAGVVVMLLAYVGILKYDLADLEANNLALNNQVVSFEALAKAEVKEAEAKVVEVIKEVEVIKWKTDTKIKTIKEYVYETNQSDCANAMAFARTYF